MGEKMSGQETTRREVFVFGSNKAGRHGAGSAKAAHKEHGAEWGNGFGLQGNSYAIPTKDERLVVMPLDEIRFYVREFINYAEANPGIDFNIVAIGCGLAGYKPRDIAPMFADAPKNCHLPRAFSER